MDPTLHKAATQGNLELLKIILTADTKTLLSRTPQQNTALHIAARLGHRDFADIILRECGALILEKNIDGDTPLHVASKFGKLEVVDLLINHFVEWPIDIKTEGGLLTTTNKLGNTALHEAATHGKSEVALMLLEANPIVSHMLNEKHESPLHIAAREGLATVVNVILKQSWVEQEKGTQPPVSGTGSPLHQAVLGGHIKIVEMLLHRRSDFVKLVDSDGNNALHYAAQNDNGKIMEMLITKEPSLAYGNNNWGQPPLHAAVYYGAKAAIKAILKHCPDTAEQIGQDGGNALHVAVNRGKIGSLKCLLKHIQPEEIINHQDYDGNTPLHLAAKQSRIQSSLLLLKDRRVNPCLLNHKGQTARSAIEMPETNTYEMFIWKELKKEEAKRCKKQQLPPVTSSRFYGMAKPLDPALHKAVTQGNLELLKIVLTVDHKTLLSRTPQQNTALHIAARVGHHDIADIMLKECETLMLDKNIDGDTPLHVASKFGNIEIVNLLIKYSVEWPIDIESEEGGPLTTKNKLGNTALHEAVTHGKSEVAMRLIEAKPEVVHILNERLELPLHIAARKGLSMVVTEILKDHWVETEVDIQSAVTGSPLHHAVLGGHIEIVQILLSYRSHLVNQVNRDGNNALHCAAQSNNQKMVEMLLRKDLSIAYVDNYKHQTPLHVAVQYGSTSAVETILKFCPDTAEQLGPDGGNALHIAVNKGMLNSLKCLLKNIWHEELINHRDFDGNTPLHLAAKQSRREMSILLAWDKKVDPCVLNNEGETARSEIERLDKTKENDLFVWNVLKKLEAKRCYKDYIPPPRDAIMQSKTEKYFNLSFETYGLIAALITTVTFAATFTMPGGYDQQSGYAIHHKEASFKIFVIFNTIAMCSALVVMVCFLWAREDMVIQQRLLHRLTILASVSLIVSLITAVYLVVKSVWLVSVVILIGLSTPVLVWFVLGFQVLSF